MGADDLEEAQPGSVLADRYLIRREIARGGSACVFEAEHVVTRAKVAVKTLTRAHLDRADARIRLLREARVLGALRHPNVVLVQDAGECPRHGPFLALQMIDGRPLDGILAARRRLPVDEAVAVVTQLCAALDAVHRHGIVHRDVKPSNVLISRGAEADRVELIDFGIATADDEQDAGPRKITRAGELLGTVEYMSPEQLMESAPIDARTDIYAAGVLLYECLSGEVPFGGGPTVLITGFIRGVRPACLQAQRPDVPARLESVVTRALEIDPHQRYASARELADACVEALDGIVPRIGLLDVRDDAAHAPAAPLASQRAVASQDRRRAESGHRRRRFARAPYVAPIRIVFDKGNTCDGRAEDISEGGLLVVTETECAANQRVKIRLPLPASGRVVVFDATTKWCNTSRNRRAVGIEFFDAPEEARAVIRAYVALMTGAPQPPPQIE
jgi:serine/threonine protein kinase